jgi:hypothetical protein
MNQFEEPQLLRRERQSRLTHERVVSLQRAGKYQRPAWWLS